MTLAVAAILGHFSKTLLLLFVPQILNFIMSLPQLAKVIPCPRHRLPHYNAATGLMEPSYVNTRKRIVPQDRTCMNLTLINLVLHICGPMREATLCSVLILLQCISCGVGLYVRYSLASLAFSSSDGSLHTGEL